MKIKVMLAATMLAMLTACGGGGDAGDSRFAPNGTTQPETEGAKAAAISVALSAPTLGSGDTSGSVTATATVVDSTGKTIIDAPVSFKISNGIYTQGSGVTDAFGRVTAIVKLGSNQSNRTIVVEASDGTHTAIEYLSVTGTTLSVTANPSIVVPSGPVSVTFTLKDSKGNSLVGKDVEVQPTNGLPAMTGKTDSNGEFVYNFTAPATNGTVSIVASAMGVVASQSVLVQNSTSVVPPVTASIQGSLEATPSVVSVNSVGSTQNRAIVRARFLNTSNQPLQNVRVKFDLDGDVNNIGGSFTASDVYSDADGWAVTSYIPASRPSPTNGLTIRACYVGSGDPSAACSTGGNQSKIVNITVVSSSVSVTIGSDENVYTEQDLVYYRRFVVQVVDGSGRAMPNVSISPQLDLIRYFKGGFGVNTTTKKWELGSTVSCQNEDVNKNNFLEVSEDTNNSGSIEPRRADAAVSYEDATLNGKTDANGRIILRVTYPRSVAAWAQMQLTISGSVDGSEGLAVWSEVLAYPASALGNADVSPAFADSPYGTVLSCSSPN
jgi:hypothetical protein